MLTSLQPDVLWIVAITMWIRLLKTQICVVQNHLCSFLLHTSFFASHTISQFQMPPLSQLIAAAIIMIVEMTQHSVNINSKAGREISFLKSVDPYKMYYKINVFISILPWFEIIVKEHYGVCGLNMLRGLIDAYPIIFLGDDIRK